MARKVDRSALHAQAIRLLNHPPTMRTLSSEMMHLLSDEQLLRALDKTWEFTGPANRKVIEQWKAADDLADEQAHFFDPNRPGE